MMRDALALGSAWIGALLFSGVVLADEGGEVREWLNRMNHALTNLDYQGTLVYHHDNQLDAIRIVHIANENGEHERLTSLNGAPREVVRTQDTVTCILPDDESVTLDRRLTTNLFPSMPPSQVDDLGKHYQFKLGGLDRVAGLTARVISIDPRDQYRYGYRLWLEHETGMLLRSELLDTDGEPVEQVMFTEISLGDHIPLSALEPQFTSLPVDFGPRPPSQPADIRTESAALRPEAVGQHSLEWAAASVPPGFHLKSHEWEKLSEDAPPAEHLVFTDGLSSVSVYVEDADRAAAAVPRGGSRMGAISAFSRQHDGYRITVVGEVPPVTVRSIASRIYRRSDAVAAND